MCMVCVLVWVYMRVEEPLEARRGHPDPWNWCHRQFPDNPGPLQGHEAFLSAEPSLWPQLLI